MCYIAAVTEEAGPYRHVNYADSGLRLLILSEPSRSSEEIQIKVAEISV
jgi:hypothetical protein